MVTIYKTKRSRKSQICRGCDETIKKRKTRIHIFRSWRGMGTWKEYFHDKKCYNKWLKTQEQVDSVRN